MQSLYRVVTGVCIVSINKVAAVVKEIAVLTS